MNKISGESQGILVRNADQKQRRVLAPEQRRVLAPEQKATDQLKKFPNKAYLNYLSTPKGK